MDGACKLVGSCKLVEASHWTKAYRAFKRITKLWEKLYAIIDLVALLCKFCIFVTRLYEHIPRAISSLAEKDK